MLYSKLVLCEGGRYLTHTAEQTECEGEVRQYSKLVLCKGGRYLANTAEHTEREGEVTLYSTVSWS